MAHPIVRAYLQHQLTTPIAKIMAQYHSVRSKNCCYESATNCYVETFATKFCNTYTAEMYTLPLTVFVFLFLLKKPRNCVDPNISTFIAEPT